MNPTVMAANARAEVHKQHSLSVDVQVVTADSGIPDIGTIKRWVKLAVVSSGRSLDAPTEVVVRVVGLEEIITLNRQYRQQAKPTNVLSFPTGDVNGLPEEAESLSLLGDVVVCAPVVAAEAERQGKQPGDHWGHILVHGTLHLLGYDHEANAAAAEMELLERQILAQRGVADPYRADND